MPQKIISVWEKTIVRMDDREFEFKDCKVWPGHCEEWNWNLTGTRHVPGIQVTDLQDMATKVDYLILTSGYRGALKTKSETLDYLDYCRKYNGLIFFNMLTPEGVNLYNRLSAVGKKVGILVHSTC